MRYAVALLVLLAACGGDANGPQLQPASFAAVDGIGQTDTVGRELKELVALRVIATDGATPVPNYPITWTALDGGQVFATVVYSGTDGIARQRWTLGTAAGQQRLVARALEPETGAVLVDDTVAATATPDTAYRVAFARDDSVLAVVDDTLRLGLGYADRFANVGASCTTDGGYFLNDIVDTTIAKIVGPSSWTHAANRPAPALDTVVVAVGAVGRVRLYLERAGACVPEGFPRGVDTLVVRIR